MQMQWHVCLQEVLIRDASGTSTRRCSGGHPLIENPENFMKYLMRTLMRLINPQNRPSAEERYLAQSVDANEFEVRAQALERRRA